MASHDVIRTSIFGGFKKDDVIDYIEDVETKLHEADEASKSSAAEVEELRRKLAEAEAVVARFEEEKRRAESLRSETETLRLRLDERDAKIHEYDITLATLEKKLQELEESCAGLSDSEQQINGLVMDAIGYSDRIARANQAVIAATAAEPETDEGESGAEIGAIGSEIGKISGDFGELIVQLSKKLSALSDDILELTSRFEAGEPTEDDGQFHLGEDGIMLIDEMYKKKKAESDSAEETEDGDNG